MGDKRQSGFGKDDHAGDKDTGGTGARRMGKMGHHKQVSSDGAWGQYPVRGAGQEESADKSAKWSGAESKGSVTEEEAETAGGGGGRKINVDGNCVGDAVQRQGRGATPGRPLPWPPTRREWRGAMGRG